MGALGIISYNISKPIIQNKVADASKQTILLAADKLEQNLKVYEDVTMQMLTDNDFMKSVRSLSDSSIGAYEQLQAQQSVSTKLGSFFSGKTEISNVSLINTKTAKNISTSGSAVSSEDTLKAAWFKKITEKEGGAVWLPTQPKGYYSASEPSFALGRLFRDPSTGAKDFLLLIEIKSRVLNETLDKLSLAGKFPVVIIDEESKLVRAGKAEDNGKAFEVTLAKEKQEASGTEAHSDSLKGRLVIYKNMKVSGWTVASAVTISELVEETGKIANATILMVIFAILVAIGAGMFMARMINRPLTNLRNLMQEGERGNLTVRTKVTSKDEIGQVGVSFNQMMDQITKLVQQTNHSAAEVLNTSNVLLNVSKQTATSAREIAVATEEIANGASSLAVEAEKGNTITHEIGMKMKEVVRANQDMGRAATEVEQVSQRGTVYMTDLIGKTNMTEQMTRSMVEKVDRLKDSTSSIRKILDVLNNMTKQTNILSLNATIEAARAGAAGKGFMVVADEIRKLAEQSKQSIEVVGQITETIQREIDETVSVLSDAYPVFKEQINAVKEAELIFKQVRGQMGSLTEGLSEVTQSVEALESSQHTLTEAMSNVSAVSEESSATSEEVASLSSEQLNVSQGLVKLSENLEALSVSLQEQLSKFKV
ncbi:methyl-accepting chemotaxis protein [Gorillibacterium sp. sgz5001074]|uniref:methyl-accepting chemotaxis protein n=1 Tax=Gorillibacterium sp. sgz5001074 TaxID=3446695 RepID=UPI003F66D036